jgi:hypothetical protein
MNKATSVRAGESVSRQCQNLFTFVDAREMVNGPCLAGMPLAAIFNILLGPVHSLLDHTPKFD